MKKFFLKLANAGRKKNNADVIERMKEGDSLQRYSAQSSWYPPRPVIKKDAAAIAELYKNSESDDKKGETTDKQDADEKPA